jgi:hypothetical protein
MTAPSRCGCSPTAATSSAPPARSRSTGCIGYWSSRFPTRGHFASWDGTAPLDASSGDQTRHRLSRAGNRRINRALHIMAVVQLRHPDTDGRRYYDRRVAEGKTPMEAMRALKRRLSDVVYRQLVNDQKQQPANDGDQDTEARKTGPEGYLGATTNPARPAQTPTPALRTSHFPSPSTSTLPRPPTPGPVVDVGASVTSLVAPAEPSIEALEDFRRAALELGEWDGAERWTDVVADQAVVRGPSTHADLVLGLARLPSPWGWSPSGRSVRPWRGRCLP